jgi:hypothetical protein
VPNGKLMIVAAPSDAALRWTGFKGPQSTLRGPLGRGYISAR